MKLPVHAAYKGCAASRWAECQDVVIRTGRAAYLCWRREGVNFSRFASRADVCAANSLAESQGFLGRSVRAANTDGAVRTRFVLINYLSFDDNNNMNFA